MKMSGARPPPKLRAVAEIRSVRSKIDDKVQSKIDVIGSMIGVKVTGAKATGEIGITYFVTEKIPLKDLSPAQRIPKTVSVGAVKCTTDVLVMPEMDNQAADAVITHDGNKPGTLSCFALAEGERFGLTCGHCLWGQDENPSTPTNVSIYDPRQNRLVECGQSVFAIFAPSVGIDKGGFIDCGVFSLESDILAERARRAKPLLAVTNLATLLNTKVFSVSAQKRSPDQERTALVIGVDEQRLGHRSDLVLSVDAPGTFGGDSGMLWMTKNGRAVGIHTRGERMLEGDGSSITTAMAAFRAQAKLGVKLLYG